MALYLCVPTLAGEEEIGYGLCLCVPSLASDEGIGYGSIFLCAYIDS